MTSPSFIPGIAVNSSTIFVLQLNSQVDFLIPCLVKSILGQILSGTAALISDDALSFHPGYCSFVLLVQ